MNRSSPNINGGGMNALAQATNKSTAVAQVAGKPVADTDQSQYLTFMLGAEMFAVSILAVKEIIEYEGITTVPMMPACIRGVLNLRGAVVPVMDLSVRFGRAPINVTKRTCIVIVEIEMGGALMVIGMVVDAVNAVLDIPASEIEPAPAFGTKVRAEFIHGMGKVNGKFVLLLNTDQALSADEMDTLAEVGVGAQQ
jgi:purine-binding chemotaxis protein CheW